MSQEQIAKVLAEHQKVSMGMTSGSPDTCRCGERIYPERNHDIEVTHRRDVAFAAHQAAVLAPLFAEARAEALREAAQQLDADASDSSYREEESVTQAQLDAATWLRTRATHIEGRALVAGIHERKKAQG